MEENKLQFIFLGVCVLLIIFLRVDAIAPIILWYIVLSVVQKLTSHSSKKEAED